jgi:hypothetical protein
MNGLTRFVQEHSIWDTIVIYWIFSAAVNAMPEPDDASSSFYRWIYLFLTAIAGHIHDAMNRQPKTVKPA